jgi:hypothetical protein
MGHTKKEDLKDVQDILDVVRTWENIIEKSPNVFYYKSIPFLHFHDKEGRRWADGKLGKDWGPPIKVPFDLSPSAKSKVLKEIKKRYASLAKPKQK